MCNLNRGAQPFRYCLKHYVCFYERQLPVISSYSYELRFGIGFIR